MSAIEYVSEDGDGRYGQCHVPDLVPTGGATDLVFVFESPHVDELQAELPVVGSAGRSALRFLLPDEPKGQSLGWYVHQRHEDGDHRVGIVNVSNVPMQAAAFVNSKAPDLDLGEWTLIERVRRSRARRLDSVRGEDARAISEALVGRLRDRLPLAAAGPGVRIVAAGTFAQRMVDMAAPDLTPSPLRVPHPSYNQWNRVANQALPDLIETRARFAGVPC